jgi:hypothetical protein
VIPYILSAKPFRETAPLIASLIHNKEALRDGKQEWACGHGDDIDSCLVIRMYDYSVSRGDTVHTFLWFLCLSGT